MMDRWLNTTVMAIHLGIADLVQSCRTATGILDCGCCSAVVNNNKGQMGSSSRPESFIPISPSHSTLTLKSIQHHLSFGFVASCALPSLWCLFLKYLPPTLIALKGRPGDSFPPRASPSGDLVEGRVFAN
jgi:hypothetical protein